MCAISRQDGLCFLSSIKERYSQEALPNPKGFFYMLMWRERLKPTVCKTVSRKRVASSNLAISSLNIKKMDKTINEKKFNDWLKQFIKDYGHSFGGGFYVELNTGEYFYRNDEEYRNWYENKQKEFLELE